MYGVCLANEVLESSVAEEGGKFEVLGSHCLEGSVLGKSISEVAEHGAVVVRASGYDGLQIGSSGILIGHVGQRLGSSGIILRENLCESGRVGLATLEGLSSLSVVASEDMEVANHFVVILGSSGAGGVGFDLRDVALGQSEESAVGVDLGRIGILFSSLAQIFLGSGEAMASVAKLL